MANSKTETFFHFGKGSCSGVLITEMNWLLHYRHMFCKSKFSNDET